MEWSFVDQINDEVESELDERVESDEVSPIPVTVQHPRIFKSYTSSRHTISSVSW